MTFWISYFVVTGAMLVLIYCTNKMSYVRGRIDGYKDGIEEGARIRKETFGR